MKSREIYKSSSISSCGACSIASIVSHYGGYVPLETILDDTHTSNTGTNALNIVNALKKYGFNSYGEKVWLEKIKSSDLPVIAHTFIDGYEHFLVIYEINNKNITTMDPRCGKKIYPYTEFKKIYKNVIIICEPLNVVKYEKKYTLIKLFKNLIKTYKTNLIIISILSIIILILNIINGLYIKIIDNTTDINLCTFIFITITIVDYLIIYIKNRLVINLSIKLDRKLNSYIVDYIFHIKRKYIKNKRVGEIVNHINNLGLIENTILNMLFINILNILLIIISLIIIINISPTITLITIITSILIVIIYKIFLPGINNMNEIIYEKNNYYYGVLNEYLSSIDSIKNLNIVNKSTNYLNRCYSNYLDYEKSVSGIYNSLNTFKGFIMNISLIITDYIGLILINKNIIDWPILMVINSLCLLFSDSFMSLLDSIPDVVKSKTVLMGTSEFLDLPREVSGDYSFKAFKTIKIVNLSYSYDGYNYILNNLNIKINHGDKILIKAKSGYGKSTLAKCISQNIDDYVGHIYLDDTDIKDIPINILRDKILYIGQNERLFVTSIKENITLGKDVNYEEVSKICKIDDIIKNKKMNMNSIVLEDGSNLSLGEKSRIILARSLLKKPDILIIDETLSSVNKDMEDEIIGKLLEMNMTLIYITHRDKTNLFDKIIDLERRM